jgi:beta-lactamase class A
MNAFLTRRTALVGSLLAASGLASGKAEAQEARSADAEAGLAELERRYGGRLGVAILDTATGHRIEHRGDERFAMCSTFKFLAAALVLARVDRKEERLDRQIVYTKKELVSWSPVTEKHAGGPGMTVAELCEAAMTISDNTAGNLLLASFGGPAGLTAFARSLGDGFTRLDRLETVLNEAKPGDPRDTTMPTAMLANMHKLVIGDVLSKPSRDQLIAWLLANKTGGKRLQAGVPTGWRVGDKTGTGANGVTNDIAVIWPPDRGPLVVTAYFAESPAPDDQRNLVIAEVGRIAARI